MAIMAILAPASSKIWCAFTPKSSTPLLILCASLGPRIAVSWLQSALGGPRVCALYMHTLYRYTLNLGSDATFCDTMK